MQSCEIKSTSFLDSTVLWIRIKKLSFDKKRTGKKGHSDSAAFDCRTIQNTKSSKQRASLNRKELTFIVKCQSSVRVVALSVFYYTSDIKVINS